MVRALALALFLLAAAVAGSAQAPADSGPRVAPAFTERDVLGSRTVSLADYRGKVVMINFRATWRPPCTPSSSVPTS